MPQLGSAESKSCTDKSSAAWLCDETRNGQLQHLTVTPASLDRITNQVADATESQDTKKSATERSSKLYLLNKQVFWSYHMPVPVALRKHVKPFLLLLLAIILRFWFSLCLNVLSYVTHTQTVEQARRRHEIGRLKAPYTGQHVMYALMQACSLLTKNRSSSSCIQTIMQHHGILVHA